MITEFVNTVRFPIHEPTSEAFSKVVAKIRQQLADEGTAILSGFISDDALPHVAKEVAALSPRAYRTVETVNAYNVDINSDLAEGHPGRVQFERGNAFVARDLIPAEDTIQQLYRSADFQRFVAACFDIGELHPMADPMAGLVVNVLDPGREHPWHFDTNPFTVSLVTQTPDNGGTFEYVPDARAPGAENFAEIHRIISGAGRNQVRQLTLKPGDLQLFQGRFALHRVAPVAGLRERHSVIFAYCDRPGVLGKLERTRQLFGRVLPMHGDTSLSNGAADALLD